MKLMLRAYSVFAIALVIKTITCPMPPLYKVPVHKDSIIKEQNVTSISSCFFECWDIVEGCLAVGFLVGDLSKLGKTPVTCYLIRSGESGGDFFLELLVSRI